MARLTDLQTEFINQYFLCGRNATEAVIRAGYKVKDRDSARSLGSQNLAKLNIRAEIDRRLEEYSMPANEVIAALSDQARVNIGDFFDISEKGFPRLNLKKAEDRGVLHLVSKIEIIPSEHGSHVKIDFHNAQNALVQLGRYHKLFTDKVRVDDWKSDAIEMIRNEQIDYPYLAEEFGEDLATQLFIAAGVSISSTR